MSSELEKLRELMDESVYKKKRFTDKEMKKLFRNVRSNEKRILWIPQTLTVIFTSAFLGVGGLYLYDYVAVEDISGWQQSATTEDFISPSEAVNSSEWKTIHSSEINMADFISLESMDDEEFLSDLRGPVKTSKSNGEDTLRVHRYTSGADVSSHLIIEQWQTASGSPEWLKKQMEQLKTKESVKVEGTTIHLQNYGGMNIGFFNAGKLAFYVLGDADIISLVEVQRILEHIRRGEDFSNLMEYEGGTQ